MKRTVLVSSTLLIATALIGAIAGVNGTSRVASVKAANNDVGVSKTVNLLTNIGTYGTSLIHTWSSTWQGTTPSGYSTTTVKSNAIDDTMVDSILDISAYVSGGGITVNSTDTSQVAVRNAKVTWELTDYSRYIKNIEWTLNSTDLAGYNQKHTLALYTNRDLSGTAFDTKNGNYANPISVSMSDSTNETINAVSFVDKDDATTSTHFLIQANNMTYTLGEVTSLAQQATFFLEAFYREVPCVQGTAPSDDIWTTFQGRTSTISTAIANLADSTWV
ncbi:MAG: hypothetical protein K5694_07220, partial [Bacilli bacterium]|nr:hypothetical protein [Bacilli bacterium]